MNLRYETALIIVLTFGTIAAMIVGSYYLLEHGEWAEREAGQQRMDTFMRECVPKQPAKRCLELWKWVEE